MRGVHRNAKGKERNKGEGQAKQDPEGRTRAWSAHGVPFIRLPSRPYLRAMQHAFAGKEAKEAGLQVPVDRENKCGMQAHDIPYSQFMHGLKLTNVALNRKSLADMAVNDPTGFGTLVEKAKGAVVQ